MPSELIKNEFVVYHPPKSIGFGHHSRIRDGRKSLQFAQKFLTRNTIFNLASTIKLTVQAPSQWTNQVVSEQTVKDAIGIFGQPKHSSYWEFSSSLLPEALEFAFADEQRPKQALGPVLISFSYQFEWEQAPARSNDFNKRFYNKGSTLGILIGSRKFFLQPTFIFPWVYDTQELHEFLIGLEPELPFRFRDDYFKRVVPTKDGKSERLLKLPKSWLHGS